MNFNTHIKAVKNMIEYYEQAHIFQYRRYIIMIEYNDIKITCSGLNKFNNCKQYTRQPIWHREEVILLVSEYYRVKSLSKSEQEESIKFISYILRLRANKLNIKIDDTYRNISGIGMKFGNMKSLDQTLIENGKTGLKNVSKLECKIVNEYEKNPEKIYKEAYYIVMKYLNTEVYT